MAARGDAQRAHEEQQAFEEWRAKVPADSGWGQSKARDVLAMASHIAAARLAGLGTKAVEHWKQAVAM